MGGLFDVNSGVMGFLGKICDVIFLSIIWLIFSLPIFTIGASTTALYYSCVKAIRRERGYVLKSFWHSFKTNFKNATILWVPYAILMFLLVYVNIIKYALNEKGTMGFALLCIYSMIAFLVLCTGIYMFPILSRFTMTKRQIIKSAFFMAIKHFPFTLIMVVILVATALAHFLIPAVVLFLPTLSVLLLSLVMEPILKKYTPKTDGDEPKDEWYLE